MPAAATPANSFFLLLLFRVTIVCAWSSIHGRSLNPPSAAGTCDAASSGLEDLVTAATPHIRIYRICCCF
jgi:hypothetical protein